MPIMRFSAPILNTLVAAAFALSATEAGAQSDPDRLQSLLEQLREPDLPNWQLVEEEIFQRWALSGSPAMDLLLRRGQDALDAGDIDAALDHLTALTDHAPDFAAGWNARATVYFHAGLYGPSIADIQRTLALNPDHFGALTGLGRMLEELGEIDAALSAYQAAHAIHPNRPDLEEAMRRVEAQVEGQSL